MSEKSTKRMTVEVIELPDSPNGKIKKYTEERDVPYTEGRDDEICCICGFPEYPECKSFCGNFKKSMSQQ